MKKSSSSLLPVLVIIALGVITAACANKFFIAVDYRPPVPAKKFSQQTVRVEMKDMRSTKTILSNNAAKDFEGFTGLFSLFVEKGKKEKLAVGGFQLLPLFKAAFSQRMEDMGIQVLKDSGTTDLAIEIALQKFFLDLVDRKWRLEISYDASLTKGSRVLAKETISGKAERVKILGAGEAEKLIGNLFTDVVNDLDIEKLLNKADQ
jgi:hypothetical protein